MAAATPASKDPNEASKDLKEAPNDLKEASKDPKLTKDTKVTKDTKIPMEQMLREIAKQEADRRMAKFRQEIAGVKQERDRYKEQLELMEEEFVKERQGKLDLKEEMQRMQGTIEELQARHAEASKVPNDAGSWRQAEDTVKYQSQIAHVKGRNKFPVEVRIKSHESNASTFKSRHEEILSEALQAAAQQSDRAERSRGEIEYRNRENY